MEVLRTEHLVLRHLTPDDAHFIHELVNDRDWLRYIGDRGVRTEDDARAYIERGPMAMYTERGFGLYCVTLRDSGEPIGICGILKRDTLEEVDLGFALLPAFRSRGYAFEAAAATIEHERRAHGLTRIVAIVSQENQISQTLLAKLGFAFERTIQLASGAAALALYAIEGTASTAGRSQP